MIGYCILNNLAIFQLMNELLRIRLDRIVKIRLIVDLGPCNQANLETHRSRDLYESKYHIF